jgi:hypothetical protein
MRAASELPLHAALSSSASAASARDLISLTFERITSSHLGSFEISAAIMTVCPLACKPFSRQTQLERYGS